MFKKTILFFSLSALFLISNVEGRSQGRFQGSSLSWFQSCWQWKRGENALQSVEKPLVTFFGGSRIKEEDPLFQDAFLLAKTLAEHGFAIVTGGNQGIMKAANCGASTIKDQGITSISVNVKGLPGENSCSEKKILTDHFSVRKGLMMNYSSAFVIFPGGIGTLDELSEVMTLIFTHNLEPVPVYIVGNDYWEYLRKWFDLALKKGLMEPEVLKKVIFTDNFEEIEKGIIQIKHYKRND